MRQPSGAKDPSSESAFTCFKCSKSNVERHSNTRVCTGCYDNTAVKAEAARYRREYNLLRKFGITVEDYEEMLESQDGGCAICHRRPKPGERRLAVDHCHKTGSVRGLLCGRCNRGIGFFRDHPVLMQRAIEYVLMTKTLEAH